MTVFPVEDFKIPPYNDADVIRVWKWFRTFISAKKWEERKAAIEKMVSMEFRSTPPFSDSISKGTAITIKGDLMGWYLYLVEVLITEPHKYEFFQGARVIPIFKRLGMDFELLIQIEGVKAKVRKLLNLRMSEADALLFEILTALVWARNGWQVTFLEESKTGKMPDLYAQKGNQEWYIECKRQSKTSDYAQKERLKWQNMISHISKLLIDHNLLLNIVFHVELTSLPDTFLKDLLYTKLPLVVQAGKVVATQQIDIDVDFVDIAGIKDHLSRSFVKNASPQMAVLIGKKTSDNIGFASGMKAGLFRIGPGTANNLYVHDIERAYGAFWHCDAKESIVAKARDIKRQVHAALEQFQPEHKAVIHIGLETFDGPSVEQERLLKISDTLDRIELNGKNLQWAYCHFFQAYSPPDENWTFDETVNTISRNPPEGIPPLESKFLIVPEDVGEDNLSHWERPLP